MARIIIVAFLLSGCASERLLTPEQDEAVAKQCAQGCRVVPLPVWKQIEDFIRQFIPQQQKETS